jgi:hypothetical protein
LFVLATAFATLGLGEHYLADLIVAFPFTLIFQSACTTSVPWSKRVRRDSFYIGIFLTVVWLLLLRFGVQLFAASLFFPWGLLVVTVVWSIMLERDLAVAALGSKSRIIPKT